MKISTIGMILFFCTTLYWVKLERGLRHDYLKLSKSTKKEIELLKSNNKYLRVRLQSYYLISIEQNGIINKFHSSKEEKFSNKTLMELQTTLD